MAILLISLNACQDEIPEPELQANYVKIGAKEIATRKVFCQTGEIKTEATVQRFLEQAYSIDDWARYIKESPYVLDSVRFSDLNNAQVRNFNHWIDCEVSTKGSTYILTDTKTSLSCCFPGDPFTKNPGYFVSAFKPNVIYEYVSSSTFGTYYFGYQTNQQFVIRNSNGKWVAPYVAYHIYTEKFNYSGGINNAFQSDFYKHLAVNDTIVIAEFEVQFDTK